MNLQNCLFVAIGGALGAVSRFFLAGMVSNKTGGIIPWGTFTVNILGSFLLGFIFVLGTEKSLISPQYRLLIGVGFLGAFTTFSTFSLETLNIIREGNYSMAFFNLSGSVLLGLLAVWCGLTTANLLR